jgi:hypothetical protein
MVQRRGGHARPTEPFPHPWVACETGTRRLYHDLAAEEHVQTHADLGDGQAAEAEQVTHLVATGEASASRHDRTPGLIANPCPDRLPRAVLARDHCPRWRGVRNQDPAFDLGFPKLPHLPRPARLRRPTRGNLDVYKPDTVGGGHTVALVSYTPDRFIVRNSWGTGWGDNGYTYASEGYARAAFTEAYGVTV